MRGAEHAVGLVLGAEQAAQLGPGRQRHTRRRAPQRGVRRELHDRHRRRRRQVVRIDHLQQRLREGRELRLHLELDAGGQEREAFQQPLDIRVGDLGVGEVEPAGDLRELVRELRAHVAHEGEFVLVVLHQPRVHQRRPTRSQLGDHGHPRLDLDRGLQEQLLRHRLRPQLALDLEHERGHRGVVPRAARVAPAASPADARLEGADRVGELAFQRRRCAPTLRAGRQSPECRSSASISRRAGSRSRSVSVARLEVLSSAARSRSTACRSCAEVSTCESGGSFVRDGSLSVSRSSSDGCSRSRPFRPDMSGGGSGGVEP